MKSQLLFASKKYWDILKIYNKYKFIIKIVIFYKNY